MSDQDKTSLPTILDSMEDTTAMSRPITPKVKKEFEVSVINDCQLYYEHPRGITPVDNDHPVEYFDDVKAFFKCARPSFLIRQTKTPRRDAFLTGQNGTISAILPKVEVLYRVWDSSYDCPTLDINGKRFILVDKPGGRAGGYWYHRWLGSKMEIRPFVYCGHHVLAD